MIWWIGSGIILLAILWLTVGPMFVIDLVINFLAAIPAAMLEGLGDADW